MTLPVASSRSAWRGKGVGVYFITQTPRDVPSEVLGQLGNRVQHALRAGYATPMWSYVAD
jgi:DNA helicase HerA-like ATPase